MLQAGNAVTVFEAAQAVGGRLASLDTPFGSFDMGAQYFTLRGERMRQALECCAASAAKRWSASALRVLDAEGQVVTTKAPSAESHWVGVPTMDAIAQCWAEPFAEGGQLHLGTPVTALVRDTSQAQPGWKLLLASEAEAGATQRFDGVVLALPAPQAHTLLNNQNDTAALAERIAAVRMAPNWALMLAYPQAMQPDLQTLGPQWSAAHSTHHRIRWLARESSKPGRGPIERWTVQASANWSQEHACDSAERVADKLQKAFGEVTGIRTAPAWRQAHFWPYAETINPLRESHIWEPALGVGLAGDWCLGERVESAFGSGLELALSIID